MFPFEKLEVWHDAIAYADTVYTAAEEFPTDERFELKSQLRRSCNSVAANLAEGSCRDSDREKLRYVEIAFGSLMETVSHLRLAHVRCYITEQTYKRLYQDSERLGKRLSSLRASIRRRIAKK